MTHPSWYVQDNQAPLERAEGMAEMATTASEGSITSGYSPFLAQETLARIEEMGASLDRSPYDGTWSASCQGPGWPGERTLLRSYGAATPSDAIALLWHSWRVEGSPEPRCYTEEEAEEIREWCDSRQAALSEATRRGRALPHPYIREPVGGVANG